jgi:hypothetical protein
MLCSVLFDPLLGCISLFVFHLDQHVLLVLYLQLVLNAHLRFLFATIHDALDVLLVCPAYIILVYFYLFKQGKLGSLLLNQPVFSAKRPLFV